LLAEDGKEGRDERGGKASKKDCLDLNKCLGRAVPLWEGWRVIPEGGVIDLINENTEEGSSLVVWVRLEVRVDLDDECGADSGEQTSLLPRLRNVYQNSTQNLRRSVCFSNPDHASS